MIGCLIGAACVAGLVRMACHRSCGGCRGACGGYGGGSACCGESACGGSSGRSGRWASWGHRGHCAQGGPGGHGGHGGWSGEGFGGMGGPGRWMLRGLFQRLQTTPGQERVILEAVETLKAQRATVKEVFRATRADAANGFRAEGFDEALMGAAFARQDDAITAVRKAAMDAFAKVHAALDERQRRDLADIIEQGPAGWAQGGHTGHNHTGCNHPPHGQY